MEKEQKGEKKDKIHRSIKEWADDDRPREKLAMRGADALSKSELLAILIHHGTRNKSAVAVAADLLQAADGNLNAMARMSIADMQKIEGIGFAKAVTILAALELGRRKEKDKLVFKNRIIKAGSDIVDYLQSKLEDAPHEIFYAIFLNRGMRILKEEAISFGGITGTVVDIRILAKRALELGATGVIVSHNHPSGNLRPSEQDKMLTRRLKEGLRTLDIELIDHIIVSNEGYHSFNENGDL
jgi:DNA repair protein RadC